MDTTHSILGITTLCVVGFMTAAGKAIEHHKVNVHTSVALMNIMDWLALIHRRIGAVLSPVAIVTIYYGIRELQGSVWVHVLWGTMLGLWVLLLVTLEFRRATGETMTAQEAVQAVQHKKSLSPSQSQSRHLKAMPWCSYGPADLTRMAQAGYLWVIFEGGVYDISDSFHSHPGGAAVLRAMVGKDITQVRTYIPPLSATFNRSDVSVFHRSNGRVNKFHSCFNCRASSQSRLTAYTPPSTSTVPWPGSAAAYTCTAGAPSSGCSGAKSGHTHPRRPRRYEFPRFLPR